MPLHSGYVGISTSTHTHEVDVRWLMAYAASLGDLNPRYMDTTSGKVFAHPLFPVCLEWPVNLEQVVVEGLPLETPEESARVVHGSHDLHIYRPIRAGDSLNTVGTLIGLRSTGSGTISTTRLDSTDADTGDLVVRTYQYGFHRGVSLEGGDKSCEEVPEIPQTVPMDNPRIQNIEVREGAAHIYTECARIWNPIHTDRAIAISAGLPNIILHGTATLAMAISRIVDAYTDGDVAKVTRVGGRFSQMVFMPSTLKLESQRNGDMVSFQVSTDAGGIVISQGFVCLAERV